MVSSSEVEENDEAPQLVDVDSTYTVNSYPGDATAVNTRVPITIITGQKTFNKYIKHLR